MSFFYTLLQTNNLQKHDNRPLWKYMLSESEYTKLISEINNARPINIDPRDVTLYYAEWWKKNYHGGKPSKQEIYDSLKGNVKYNFDSEEFYKLAIKGARMLGVKWISKQNTLYFRTLLLQGGLPLAHISENQGKYQNFLLAVLEEQPETIEDFIFKPNIINLLPISSQNEIVYENCLEIVKSILNDENIYDDLLASNDVLVNITNSLIVRKQTLVKKQRISKPKNYWLLNFKNDKIIIDLRIGLADSYSPESLSNILGFEVIDKEYQLYINEELICVFRKMINGNYKTDWYQQKNQEWNVESKLPYVYVMKNDEKYEVTDFIDTIPNLDEPSLWSKFSDFEWRLIKGNGSSNIEAAVLFPVEWYCNFLSVDIKLYNQKLSWLTFEGEVEIFNQKQVNKYVSGVNSFEWTIESKKPSWMIRSSIPIVNNIPLVILYDENSNKLPNNSFKTYIKKHNSDQTWSELANFNHLPAGCIDLKIEKEGLIAYDMFFNSSNLQVVYKNKSIDKAVVEIRNKDGFEFKIDESPILSIKQINDSFSLQVNTSFSKIPTKINGSVGLSNKKKLFFEMASPFEGMAIINSDGKIIDEVDKLTLANLYGLRILSKPNSTTVLRIKNKLKTDVIISKEIKESSQPVISFIDEITRLYYLADAMDYKNQVILELKEGNTTKTYEINGFSHTLNVDEQFENLFTLNNGEDELELYAVPLNCKSENVEIIPLVKNELIYSIPITDLCSQFIIISSFDNGKQLMPRFVNTDVNYIGISKEERIENFYNLYDECDFDQEIWKQLIAYFNICTKNNIPFSTFDQLRAISKSSKVAAKAFLFLGINLEDTDEFIQKSIPEMEKDLGFCFHWIKKEDWENELNAIDSFYNNQYFEQIFKLISLYMHENGFDDVLKIITGEKIVTQNVHNSDIIDLRSQLGERVLRELPLHCPKIMSEYNISISNHEPVKLLLQSPIAVAESIGNVQKKYPIWAGDDHRERIRRNIQYSQYLNPEFYSRVILHVLQNQ